MPEPARLIGDFHRMTEVMGKVDHLGQMAVNPPKLPEPADLINTSALPDLSSMAEMLGPAAREIRKRKHRELRRAGGILQRKDKRPKREFS